MSTKLQLLLITLLVTVLIVDVSSAQVLLSFNNIYRNENVYMPDLKMPNVYGDSRRISVISVTWKCILIMIYDGIPLTSENIENL